MRYALRNGDRRAGLDVRSLVSDRDARRTFEDHEMLVFIFMDVDGTPFRGSEMTSSIE
jgi:hypothetical protein